MIVSGRPFTVPERFRPIMIENANKTIENARERSGTVRNGQERIVENCHVHALKTKETL
jgi:hypothetical protein